MIVTSLELKDFRNFPELKLDLDRGVNIIYGKNAQGKTNILEGLYTGCTSKSCRCAKEREMIRFSCEEAHIKVNVLKHEVSYRIDLHIKKNKAKGIAVNGSPIRKVSDLFGIANVVCFSPEDLGLIKDGPALRRRFMDMELCQLDRTYMHDLISYNKVIDQKNRILKDLLENRKNAAESTDLLPVYNEQLVQYGSSLIRRRRKFIGDLNELISGIHRKLTGGREELVLKYEENVKENEFAYSLLVNQEREMRNGVSLTGPHRDDLGFQCNRIDLRHFGSQGQQRSAALSLKMAEIGLVQKITGDRPLLLLDDVLSELDRERQDMLLDSIHDIQTLITCTGIDDLLERRFSMDRVFVVEDQKVRIITEQDLRSKTG